MKNTSDDIQSAVTAAHRRIDDTQSHCETMNVDILHLSENVSGSEFEMKRVQQDVNYISEQLKLVKSSQLTLAQLKKEMDSKQLILDGLQHQLDYMNTMLRAKQEWVSDVEANVSRLQSEILDVRLETKDTLKITQFIQDALKQNASSGITAPPSSFPSEDESTPLSLSSFSDEIAKYQKQVQILSANLNELQQRQSSIGVDQTAGDQIDSPSHCHQPQVATDTTHLEAHITKCQHEILKVEGQLVSLLTEIDVLNQERSQTESHLETMKSNVSGLQQGHETLRSEHESLLAQIQPIHQEIIGIEQQINDIKSEFSVKSDQFEQKNASQNLEIGDIRMKLQGAMSEQCKILSQNVNLSELCESLENEYKSISTNFKQQYDTLQKRYQQLHTIMVSNMEETERGNQSVRELVDVHTRIEKDYKDITNSYEQQQQEYQESLKERDSRLKLLEDQVKHQLGSVDSRLGEIQRAGGQVGNANSSIRGRLSSRLEELSQPRQITQKKTSSSQ